MKHQEEHELRSSITNALSYQRIAKGITQQELADRLGTSKSSISRLESGNQNISVDYAEQMADAMGLKARFVVEEPVETTYDIITEYDLKLYDESLLSFTITRDLGYIFDITYVNKERQHLLPVDLDISSAGIEEWLRNRSIPQNRAYAMDILLSLNLLDSDIKGIIDVCMGLSLNDSYWVTPKHFTGKFADYNLFENKFTEALSLVAYTGGTYSGEPFRTSPEFTTNGMLRKGWRYFGKGDIWLYKGGTEDYVNSGNEPYSEFFASQIADRMGINAVQYDLQNWKGILASKCKLFTDINTSYVPIGRIVRTGGIIACIDYYSKLGDKFYNQLADMLVFDAVIYNQDRHFGNFGLLRDNKTGKFIAPAPVFDNGNSLLCYAMKDDFSKIDQYVKTINNPYGYGYDQLTLAKSVMSPRQKAMLKALINFKFKESDVSNPPSWRIKALEELVQKRVKELLI